VSTDLAVRCTDLDFHVMLAAVVGKGDGFVGLFDPVNDDAVDGFSPPPRLRTWMWWKVSRYR
jgi:hypothetical protein